MATHEYQQTHGVTSPKQVLIHVGLHKTGTTFLQETVFPHLDDVCLVHPLHYQTANHNPAKAFVHHLMYRNAVALDMPTERDAVWAYLNQQPQAHVLLTSEALFGWPFDNHTAFKPNADVLKQVFPEAKILLVVRRQDKWLESAYHQVFRAGFSQPLSQFLNYQDGQFGPYKLAVSHGPNWNVNDLHWLPYVRYYESLFGAQNVLTLPFEQLAKDPHGFLKAIYDFSGIPPYYPEQTGATNQGYSQVSATIATWVNRLPMGLKRTLKDTLGSQWHPSTVWANTVERVFPGKKQKFIDDTLSQAILDLHHSNNQALAAHLGVDLGAYGYY